MGTTPAPATSTTTTKWPSQPFLSIFTAWFLLKTTPKLLLLSLSHSPLTQPSPVGGAWFAAPLHAGAADVNKNQKVILHILGGAFVMRFDLHSIGSVLASTMTQYPHATHTLVAQHRLARDHSSCFPGALSDELTFSEHVLSCGVAPQNILISGDSAGGNVAISLQQYLQQQQTPPTNNTPPLPSGVMAICPCAHVTSTTAGSD
ncbi:uncharacterized protein GGS25DRAFT_492372 [Hypoxylon fragiforme]|uniref:uncharacterized protein n=1 Tax=Hypoxylon fragiforme TaxID=63214 RepID=UPI0020C697C8|nr:uncharacterized protein GGS25DRAFT_492372 [Hypoxylon fragiforme]KAI2608972.1 hypothetical protein GGS25DRAFT_492372 [Hypoxylon fragiforme]